jgi:dTDP-4-dehydrorhamnose reductase
VFGGSGQVGRELIGPLGGLGAVLAPTHREVDLTEPQSIRDAVRWVRPAVIVNAAALTNVDRAEREPDLARMVNEIAPGVIADEARSTNAILVHYSTDYVFDGTAEVPYEETDRPGPINVYGATKLQGEHRVSAAGTPHLIIRTSWVYSATGAGFVPTLLRQLREQEKVRVVADQVGSPTWSRSLARATCAIIAALRYDDGFDCRPEDWGVYHLGGEGAASRVEIAEEIMTMDPNGGGYRGRMVVPISAAEFAAPARRPRFSALANTRTLRRFGVTLDPWRHELRRMLRLARN